MYAWLVPTSTTPPFSLAPFFHHSSIPMHMSQLSNGKMKKVPWQTKDKENSSSFLST